MSLPVRTVVIVVPVIVVIVVQRWAVPTQHGNDIDGVASLILFRICLEFVWNSFGICLEFMFSPFGSRLSGSESV